MIARAIQGRQQLGLPGRGRLVRAGVDEVERETLEDRAGDRDRLHRLLGGVQAAERLEIGVVHRLDAERDAVDAGLLVAREAVGLDAGRVGLQRHFHIGLDRPIGGDGIQDAGDGAGLHQRGRAAAEEDRGDASPLGQLGAVRKFGSERLDESLLVDGLGPDVAVEVAIGAFGLAERPMHIDREAGMSGLIDLARHSSPCPSRVQRLKRGAATPPPSSVKTVAASYHVYPDMPVLRMRSPRFPKTRA